MSCAKRTRSRSSAEALCQDPAAPGNPDPATVKLKPTVREESVA
jgi:hypothetical protein